MLQWFKRVLREWLKEDNDSAILSCIISTKDGPKAVRFLIVGSRGGALIGQQVDGQGNETRAIREVEAISSKQFWSLWNKHNPGCRLTWEDGTPFES